MAGGGGGSEEGGGGGGEGGGGGGGALGSGGGVGVVVGFLTLDIKMLDGKSAELEAVGFRRTLEITGIGAFRSTNSAGLPSPIWPRSSLRHPLLLRSSAPS